MSEPMEDPADRELAAVVWRRASDGRLARTFLGRDTAGLTSAKYARSILERWASGGVAFFPECAS